MVNDRQIRNFSEGKGLNSDKRCKLCEEPLPFYALHFSNKKAISLGYCSFICMLGALGDKAYIMLTAKNRENQEKRRGGP
ncbi:hypothetical protein ES705_27416 [subsurface metagenome]